MPPETVKFSSFKISEGSHSLYTSEVFKISKIIVNILQIFSTIKNIVIKHASCTMKNQSNSTILFY